MHFETLLFDLDGTLVDSSFDLALAVNLLRGELGLEPLPLATVIGYVGDGATLLVTRALPAGTFKPEYLTRFLEIYREHLFDQTLPYPGIVPFLESLADRKLAVVTNKPLQLSLELLDGLDLKRFFPVIWGAEDGRAKKPDPQPVLEALQRLQSSAASAVMIGDHITDLRAGAAAGVKTCFCSYGLGRQDDVPCDFVAASPADLTRLFGGVVE